LQQANDAIKNKTSELEQRRKEGSNLALSLRDKDKNLKDINEDLRYKKSELTNYESNAFNLQS
jgi:hypothetical protein